MFSIVSSNSRSAVTNARSEVIASVGSADGVQGGEDCSSHPPSLSELVIDWEKLLISTEEEQIGCAMPVISEDNIYDLIGLRDEMPDLPTFDENWRSSADQAANDENGRFSADQAGNDENGRSSADQAANDGFVEVDSFALAMIDEDEPEIGDDIPFENRVQYDKDDPPMEVGSMYPNMAEFKMALRTHAVKRQFIVVAEKSESSRFRGFCLGEGCPWAIVARIMQDGKSVRVYNY